MPASSRNILYGLKLIGNRTVSMIQFVNRREHWNQKMITVFSKDYHYRGVMMYLRRALAVIMVPGMTLKENLEKHIINTMQ